MKSKIRTLEERRAAEKARAKRSALKALRRARKAVDSASVTLSEWEGEFLGSVEVRVETYGRAFGDPEKGGPGTALSMRQTVKLKEITAKAKGKESFSNRKRAGLGRSR